jgi:tetratricopeptide (TPR) repeat protein
MTTITISLFEHLLDRAERHRRHGQFRSALQLLRQLGSFADLPASLAAEAYHRSGLIYLKRRRFRQARRRFRLALGHQPASARLHFLLGLAWHHDAAGSPGKAAYHYEQSLKLDPRQPLCLAESGLLMVRAGDTELGLRLLRNAFDQSSNDRRVLRRMVRGLLLAGFPAEALKAARESLFRAPRDRRLRELYTELRLALARRDQELRAVQERPEPAILPFVRVVAEEAEVPRPVVREDGPEPLPGPHLVRLRAQRRRRRAP